MVLGPPLIQDQRRSAKLGLEGAAFLLFLRCTESPLSWVLAVPTVASWRCRNGSQSLTLFSEDTLVEGRAQGPGLLSNEQRQTAPFLLEQTPG